jgi:ubiquinone/menaquinone biosynthesis C-methylase UbiE
MDYDAELRLHAEVLRRACAILASEHVLDIGCGTGQTTRDAGRAASAGSALGIDTSAPMIARARELAAAEHLRNVRFEHDDAQVHPFPSQSFDVAISRFGTMFFADPVAAFRNIRAALKDNGRLVMMVWQSHDSNEWSVAIQQGPARPSDAFSLADPAVVASILEAAGFAQTKFQDVREPVYYGDSVEAAFEWVGRFQVTRELLQSLDVVAAERARERLRKTLANHRREQGVWFDSRAWIVTARCD